MAAFPDLNFSLCYTWRRWNEKSELLLGFVRITAITEAKKDPVRGPGLLNTQSAHMPLLGPASVHVRCEGVAEGPAAFVAEGTGRAGCSRVQ